MVPVRIRQFPSFIKQVVQRTRVLAKPVVHRPTFHFCYFACQSHFRYLYCALHSLKAVAGSIEYRVLVFSDADQPLSDAQVVALTELMPTVVVRPWPKSMGANLTQIGWIWRAYAVALEGAKPGDVIAKIDSDIFFFNDRVFRAVERSDADLVGDGHYIHFEFCQGGCYFFKADAVRRILTMLDATPMEEIVKGLKYVFEDIAATLFARKLGMKVWMTWFMVFPDEYRNAGRLTSWLRWKFSCAHFVMKNKTAMLDAYAKDVLGGNVPEDYKKQLEIQ